MAESQEEVREKRKPKFNDQELTVLTDELLVHKARLFGPHNTRAPARERKAIWTRILDRINAVSSAERDLEDVYKRWQDIKSKLRRDMAQHRRSCVATGGGSPQEMPLEPWQRVALQVMDSTTWEGFGTADYGAESPTTQDAAGEPPPWVQCQCDIRAMPAPPNQSQACPPTTSAHSTGPQLRHPPHVPHSTAPCRPYTSPIHRAPKAPLPIGTACTLG